MHGLSFLRPNCVLSSYTFKPHYGSQMTGWSNIWRNEFLKQWVPLKSFNCSILRTSYLYFTYHTGYIWDDILIIVNFHTPNFCLLLFLTNYYRFFFSTQHSKCVFLCGGFSIIINVFVSKISCTIFVFRNFTLWRFNERENVLLQFSWKITNFLIIHGIFKCFTEDKNHISKHGQ